MEISAETLAVGKMENCFRDASDYVERYLTEGATLTSGAAAMATLHLSARSLADMRSGQFLASSGLVIQMASVVRPVIESLNLIELFAEEPEAAERWAAGRWQEFMPAVVRKRLGVGDDPVYSWLSEVSHPRFAGLQITMYQIVREKDEGEGDHPEARVYIGGLPLEMPPVLIATMFPSNVLCMLVEQLRHCPVKEEVERTWPAVARQVAEAILPGHEAIVCMLREQGEDEEMTTRMLDNIQTVIVNARELEEVSRRSKPG